MKTKCSSRGERGAVAKAKHQKLLKETFKKTQETEFKRHINDITTKKQFILLVFYLKSSKFLTNSPHPSVDINISLIFLQNFQRN